MEVTQCFHMEAPWDHMGYTLKYQVRHESGACQLFSVERSNRPRESAIPCPPLAKMRIGGRSFGGVTEG